MKNHCAIRALQALFVQAKASASARGADEKTELAADIIGTFHAVTDSQSTLQIQGT
jgi:hypothetical protein